MIRSLSLAALALANSTVLRAKTDCPFREIGVVPWMDGGLVSGDLWAMVYLDIGKDGRVLSCSIGETNMSSQNTRSNVCRSFARSWSTTPQLRDGKPVRTTIKRKFVLLGKKHDKLESEARKRFFLEHPEEKPECYPQ